MSSIRSSIPSRVVVVGYALVVIGAIVLFINSVTEVYTYPSWYLFEFIMEYLMPVFAASGGVTAWLFLGGALETVDSRRIRMGIIGFAMQTFFLASICLTFFIVLIATSSAGISNWYITSQSFELAGGYLATAGFILMAVLFGRVRSRIDIDDVEDHGDSDEEPETDDDWDPTKPFETPTPT